MLLGGARSIPCFFVTTNPAWLCRSCDPCIANQSPFFPVLKTTCNKRGRAVSRQYRRSFICVSSLYAPSRRSASPSARRGLRRAPAQHNNYLTRYAETAALIRGTAIEVAELFVTNIVLRHDAPRVIITDTETASTADLTQSIMRLTHTCHRKTTAYHPKKMG